MALMCLGTKLCSVTVMLAIISLTGSQEILFELRDSQYQEIIFSGDVTVAMVCKITTIDTAEVEITNSGGEVVATNNGKGNCLDYVISRIDSIENSNYTCSVTYKSRGDVPLMTETRTLILHVSNGQQLCFRNGTGINQPYVAGDVLLLSCYCRITETCEWTETVVGSMLGREIRSFEELEYNNKKIRRIIVGPFNVSALLTLRYDCSGGTTVESRCSIGPAQDSRTDFIINPTNPPEGSLECPATEASTEYMQTFSPTDGDTTIPTVVSTTASSTGKPSYIPTLDSTTASSKGKQSFIPNLNSTTASSTGKTSFITTLDLTNVSFTGKPSLGRDNLPVKENNESFLAFIIVIGGICALLIVSVAFIFVFIVLKRKRKDPKVTEEGHEDNLDQSTGNVDRTLDIDNLDQNADNQDQNVGTQYQNVDGHAYGGNITDDSTNRSLQSLVSDEDVVVTDVTDGRDIVESQEALVPLPVDNHAFDYDDVEDPEDQFQTAETIDYSPLVAFMKNNTQPEQGEVFGLDAEEDNPSKPE